MQKTFCIAGPIVENYHYFLPRRLNWDELNKYIELMYYFVLHAPRQSGKTTAVEEFVRHINGHGKYAALYINIEAAQAARDNVELALITIVKILARNIGQAFQNAEPLVDQLNLLVKDQPITLDLLHEALSTWAEFSKKPIILFIDEIDSLIGDSLLSVLRQIRAGFNERPRRFPQSICLVGLRDIRDYRVWSKEHGIYVSTSSPFNIKAESLELSNFSLDEVSLLYNQHTTATGQQFTHEAIEYAFYLTQGQPWLVNALAYQACFRDVTDRSQPITKESIERAKTQLIIRRDTHLDSLIDKLNDERVRPIIDAIISGQSAFTGFKPDDVNYVADLGLIQRDSFTIANPIYQEIIPRELTWTTQQRIKERAAFFIAGDGSLEMHKLMDAFTLFYRENSGVWLKDFEYKESGPHLLLMAFLQRIINGGGSISREYALDRKRADLFIKWKDQRIVVELKIRYAEETLSKGLEQIASYMGIADATEGHLVLVDRDPHKTWEEKISTETVTFKGATVTVWTL